MKMLSFFRVNYLKDSVEVSLAQLTFFQVSQFIYNKI